MIDENELSGRHNAHPGDLPTHEDQIVKVAQAPGGGAFDLHHPPSQERIADCVHCGFCLPTCPTYALWGEEMDSPRGRIYLMKVGLEGTVQMDDAYVSHFDQCLGCMACLTACPSGVRYNELIEAVRPQIERNFKRRPADRLTRALIFALFPNPRRLRVASVAGWAYQRLGVRAALRRAGLVGRLPARLRAFEELMPPIRLRDLRRRVPVRNPADPGRPTRRRVGMITGCVQRVYFGDVNEATVRVLQAEGCEVVAPSSQGCCGALMVHAGHEPEALDRARAMIDAFERAGVDTIVINAAGCGSTLKEYGQLLRDDPAYAERARAFSAKVRDISELLAELGPSAERHPIPARLAYHDACHLAHAQGIRAQPRRVLSEIPGVELLDIPEAELCCGSAGIYNLVQPGPAEQLGRRKAANIMVTTPDAVVTANPGCLLQIRRYLGPGLPLFHPVQLVDASIRGVDPIRGRPGRDGRAPRRRRRRRTGQPNVRQEEPVHAPAPHPPQQPPEVAQRSPSG
jgi:glycolate oxidase iron-sulfur subunit